MEPGPCPDRDTVRAPNSTRVLHADFGVSPRRARCIGRRLRRLSAGRRRPGGTADPPQGLGRRRAVARDRRGAAHRRLDAPRRRRDRHRRAAFYPPHYLRLPCTRRSTTRIRRWPPQGPGCASCGAIASAAAPPTRCAIFRAERFLADQRLSRRHRVIISPITTRRTRLPALFFTDWDDALIYTADGDRRQCQLQHALAARTACSTAISATTAGCCSDSSTPTASARPTASPPRRAGSACCATKASSPGSPPMASQRSPTEMARHFRARRGWADRHRLSRTRSTIGDEMARICQGASPRDHRGLDPEGHRGPDARAVRHWLARTGTRHLGARRRAVRQCAAQPAARRKLPARRGLRLSRHGRRRPVRSAPASPSCWRATACATWLARRHRLDTVYLGRDYDGDIDAALAAHAGVRRLAGAPAEATTELLLRRQGRRRLSRPHGIRPARARRPQHHREPGRRRHQRRPQQAAGTLGVHAVRALCARRGRRARVRDHAGQPLCGALHDHHLRGQAGMADEDSRPWSMSTARRGRRSCATTENPLYADILRRFRDATGLPVLVNTSFNVHEEPIVNRPAECAARAARRPHRFRRDPASGLQPVERVAFKSERSNL